MSVVSLRRPPALRPGDRVAVLSASSPGDPAHLRDGLAVLRLTGLEPVVYDSARDPGSLRPYLAGDDALRAADLTRALTDPDVAGVLLARGGSGAQRTIAAVDWAAIPADSPKVVVGYSDVTALLEAIAVKLGWAGVHGPMISTDYTDAFSVTSLMRCLMSPQRALRLDFPLARAIVPGTARGVTLGGNLTLLTSSLGTDTSRPARGGILLIEDESEEDYRVDRMLTQLRRSGYLDGVAGIVCGTFTGCEPAGVVEEVLIERLGDLGVPMILGADIGHGGPQQAFPIGIAAELSADAGSVRLLEPPLV